MVIPFLDLQKQYRGIKDEIDGAIKRVVERQLFILGEELESFEEEFADYLNIPYVTGVGSGTDGLILSLLALGVCEGDEVITPVNGYIATAQAIAAVGAIPILVDVDRHTYQVNIQHVEEKLTARTRAIIPVHLYGSPCAIQDLVEVAKKSGVFVIEDACQSHGATMNSKKTGTFGDIAVFSFYPGKNLGSYGDGGAISTCNEEIRERLRKLRNYGQSKKYYHDEMGRNSRLDEIQAAVLRVKLRYLDKWNFRRREVATQYMERIDGCRFQALEKGGESCYHLFTVEIDQRDQLQEHLSKRGIETQIHYPVPIHLQKCFASLGYRQGDFPVAERVAQRILSLPIYSELRNEEVAFIAACINDFREMVRV